MSICDGNAGAGKRGIGKRGNAWGESSLLVSEIFDCVKFHAVDIIEKYNSH